MSRRALQIVMAVLGLIPVGTSIACFFLGPALMPGGEQTSASIDGEYRFLSAFWLGCGLVIYRTIPNVEKETRLFRFVAAIIFYGGLGRLLSIYVMGQPHRAYLAAMVLELIGVPMLVLWQASIAKQQQIQKK